MSLLSCSVLGAASGPIALTSAHRPLQQRKRFRPLLDAPPCVTWRSTMCHRPRHQLPPLYAASLLSTSRPADDNGAAIAGALSFSPQAAPSTAVADYTSAVDEPVSHCYAAYTSRVPGAS